MHETFFRAMTVLQDGGQWLGIAALGCTVGALRRRVRALEREKASLDDGEKAAMRAQVDAIRSARQTGRLPR
jgi:hypothetical protein